MKMNVTRWRPDTCGCVIEYAWDGDLPAEQRVHNFKNLEKKCDDHLGVDALELFPVVIEENKMKNKALSRILDKVPDAVKFVGSAKILKDDVNYEWQFTGKDKDRKLKISLSGISIKDNEKQLLQEDCDADFGAGKVMVM